MRFLELFSGPKTYQVFGLFGSPAAMTGDEIVVMQANNLVAQQRAYMEMMGRSDSANYTSLFGLMVPGQRRPLDERYADFKRRLAEAIAKRAK